jgi:orotate phosphoribosyltransferase
MGANVLDLLKVRRGHFPYESGYHGEIWLDLDQLFFDLRLITPLTRELATRLVRHDVEAIVGPLVGGALVAQMVAAEIGALFAYTEPQGPSTPDALYSIAYRLPASVATLLRGSGSPLSMMSSTLGRRSAEPSARSLKLAQRR